MRIALVAAFVIASAPAIAGPLGSVVDLSPRLAHLDLPRLSMVSLDSLDVPNLLPTSTPSINVPPRYGWILDDGRAFWFAAGASSVTALGAHVLVGIPTLIIGFPTGLAIGASNPPAMIPFLVGLGGGYLLAQSALSALAAVLVFNSVSKVYDGNFLVAWAAHIGGSLLGAGVSALTFGIGYMLITGLTDLVEFTGSAGVGAIVVFSVLGALPAVVVGGIALVGVPAIVGAWAMSVSATPKEGYSVNPLWKDPLPETSAIPLITIPLPG